MKELVTGTKCPLPESGCHSSQMQLGEWYLTSSKPAPRAVSCSTLLDKPFWLSPCTQLYVMCHFFGVTILITKYFRAGGLNNRNLLYCSQFLKLET